MLLSLLRISLRNVTRNTRRSLVTALAVLIGSFFIIVARGMLNGLQSAFVSGFTESQAGDVQLHHPDYLATNEALPLNKSFALGDEFRALMDSVPDIRAYSGRIMFAGQISDGNNTTLFVGIGIDPESEYKVCPRNRANILPGGTAVRSDTPRGVVIGKGLADALNVTVGSELTLLVTPKPGGLNGMDVTVSGIAEFKLPGVGNKIVHMSLPTAQRLLFMENEVTEVVIDVKDQDVVSRVNDQLKTLLETRFTSLDLVPNTWMDVGELIVNSNELMDQVLIYLIVVLFVVMVAGIVNTMLMSVFERVREIGTMMAIGVRRLRILLMFLLEAVVLGGCGAIAGTLSGLLLILLLRRTGMPLPALGKFGGTTIYPSIGPTYLAIVTLVALLAAVVAALYPAWRAARMRPAEALRNV